jgi:TonB family protein
VDAGATLLHRAPVREPAGSTVTGTLTVQATLDVKGEVSDARVLSGPEELRKDALTSVLQWHYQPGPTEAQITIQFAGGSSVTTGQGVGRGVGGGIGNGIGAGAGAGGTKGLARAAQPPVSTLRTIEFREITPEAEQQIRSLLPVREGDTISQDDRAKVEAALRGFDTHLNASFMVRGGGETTLRIFAPQITAGGATRTVTDAAVDEYVQRLIKNGPDLGTTSPVAIYKPEPQYSDAASTAKWQGAVLLSVVVNETGKPINIKVVRPLGLGLDEKAIEAVSQWRFQPGTKNGVPVPVQAQIEVTFRLPQAQ